jgi:hypothetical protein
MNYASQVARIRSLLERGGSITSYESYDRYKITRIGRIVHVLRGRGMKIASPMEERGGKRWARYRMAHR